MPHSGGGGSHGGGSHSSGGSFGGSGFGSGGFGDDRFGFKKEPIWALFLFPCIFSTEIIWLIL